MQDDLFKDLATSLQSNTSLRNFELSTKNVTNVSVEYLAEALNHNNTLESFTLVSRWISQDSIELLMKLDHLKVIVNPNQGNITIVSL
jgi:hypothetical protein